MTQDQINQTAQQALITLFQLANGEGTAHQAISARIMLRVVAGAPIPVAMDAVLGAGTYDTMVSEVYQTLRAR
jgi:hypothetical protein